MRRFLSAVLSVGLLAVASLVLRADPASASTTYTFKGGGDGHSWGQPKNWDPEGIPQDGDSVVVDANWTVLGVPTISLEQLSVSGSETGGGPHLVGAQSTITTKVLNWSQGTISASIVVSDAAQMLVLGMDPRRIPPNLSNASTPQAAPPVSLTNNGAVAQSGTLGLSSGPSGGARVINEGTWLAGPGTIASSHCCTDPGTFVNNGEINVGGTLTFDHTRFQARPQSSVNGTGTVDLLGGVPDLTGPWSLGGPDTTLSLTDVQAATIQGATTIGSGARIVQRGSSKILGKGTFRGSGAFRWLGGVIYGDLTLSSALTSVIAGPDLHEVSDAFSTGGPGLLTVEGTARQEDQTEIRLNGRIVNKGTWHVPKDASASVRAGGLVNPPKQFRNAGTIKVGEGAVLVLEALGYSNPPEKGAIEGGGTVHLSNGIHELSGGGLISGSGTELHLLDRAQVHATGTLALAFGAKVVADQGSVLRGTFTIAGSGGDLSLISATILADLTTGPKVDVDVEPGVAPDRLALDAINGTGILRTKGLVRANDGDPFEFVGPARILNSGSWSMQQAVFSGTACCADPATFVNEEDGLVVVKGPPDPDDPQAKFSSVRFVNRGITNVNGIAQFGDLSPVQADGTMKLVRSSGPTARIRTELPLRISGGVLQGHGQVDGDLRNGGTVSPGDGSTLGGIFVLGEYQQLGAGRLNLDVKGAESDEVSTSGGGLTLAGTLRVAKVGSNPLGPEDRKLLSSTHPRTGRFDTVLGLGTLGGNWRVKYMPKSVVLELV